MTKHKAVIIRIDELESRVFSDSDDFGIDDALGLNDDDDRPSSGMYVHVTWPEHVISPRFNSDANYAIAGTRSEAESYDPEAAFYGE